MIVHIVGARPQFIKLLPLYQALAGRGAPQRVLHSGQHWEAGMSEVFFQEFGLQPDAILTWSQTHEENVAAMADVLKEWQPDTVVVYGDTFSTWCAARAAKRLGLPLAHVEAGLRSFNAAMPEEEARVKTDTVSDWHFVPSERALVQLQREGLDRGEAHTLLTGDIMADALMNRKLGAPTKGRILVTMHRNTNVDDAGVRAKMVSALEELAKSHEIHWPIHPRLRAHLEQGVMPTTIQWHPPLGREAILEQLEAAEWVLTDSGGLQKEAYFCRRKCIVLRNETEWMELLETGQSFLVNPEGASNAAALHQQLLACMRRETPAEFPPVYGEGDAALRMATALWQDGPVKPNALVVQGDAENPQLRFAAEVVRRVSGVRLDFSPKGASWPQASCWSLPFERWSFAELGEDALAKAAYVASRAEEYSNVQKDAHGRFVPEASCIGAELVAQPEVPMGHVWVEQFMKRFQPDFSLAKRRTPAPTVVVDMDHRFAFAGFPASHRLAVTLKQVFTGKWGLLKAQLGAIDPFDASQVFESLMRTFGKVRWQFFAWIGPERGAQDKGPSIQYPPVAEAHAQWAKKFPSTGLHPTYAHHDRGQAGLDAEVRAWTQATSRVLQRSRYHYLRMEVPHSQAQLVKAGCIEDWSMEYAKQPGYRAGVAVPIPAWGLGPQGEALDADGIPFLTYVPVALMDQNLLGQSAETIHTTLTKWQAAAQRQGAGLVLGTHWRFFGPGWQSFEETRAYRPWVEGLKAFLTLSNA